MSLQIMSHLLHEFLNKIMEQIPACSKYSALKRDTKLLEKAYIWMASMLSSTAANCQSRDSRTAQSGSPVIPDNLH